MRLFRVRGAILLFLALGVGSGLDASSVTPEGLRPDEKARGQRVLTALAREARVSGAVSRGESLHVGAMRADFRTSLEAAFARIERSASVSPADPGQFPSSTTLPDGALVARERLATVGKVALDLVAYASSGLVVGGILSYPDDGNRHSTVIHVHGGLGGIFANADGDMVQTVIDWAQRYGRTAFAPSLRGQDGSEGSPELCLGEADDVAAAAVLLRSLKVTDPDRIAIVGGSTGGCVVLRAGPLIPGLRAVVSFVPPTDWKNLVAFHRSSYAPATETRCDGSTYAWDIGGPALADVFDNMICGHVGCSDADYDARSPIPGVPFQTAPTLVVSAGSDNVVPLDQQVLYSVLRNSSGHPVDVYVVDPCDASGTPRSAMDPHLYVDGAYHLLSVGAVGSGFLFLMQELDRP
ncbi:MAG: alpha/beta fold hydrolase [Holophagales bacterium]|nr:alpha/beta fold hydrolase [Holophagales bacterium]